MAARKITGMHKREGTSNWALRVMIPTTLRQGFYEGRSFVRVSLNTPDETMARTAALGIHQTYAETFARQQAQLQSMVQAVISPALADLLAARARARILALDDAIRFDTGALGAFLTLFAPRPASYFAEPEPVAPVVVPETGMTPEHLQALGRVHDALRLGLSSSLAMGQLKAGEQAAAHEARELGLSADWSRNRPAVLTVLRAVVGAWIDVGRRNLGDAVDTPRMPEMPEGLVLASAVPAAPVLAIGKSKGALRTLWDVRDEWATDETAGKVKSLDSQRKTERALNMLEASGSMKPLEQLTRQDAIDFRAYVKATMTGRTAKTQSDVMAAVQTLLNFAVEQRGYLSANPWAGTAIAKGKVTNRRQPWSDEDLGVLMSSPIWTRYEMPKNDRAGREAAYWAPLIALYGGLRLSEACQLCLRDVTTRDGVLLMDVNEEEGESLKSVKSHAGTRIVPVHSKLLALGFSDYLANIRRRSDAEGSGAEGLVFPDLRVVPTRTGAINFSDGFRAIARSMNIYRRWRDFHSLRTTTSTCLRGVHPGLGESLILAVMGHEGKNIGQTNYTVHSPKALKRVIEHLEFPALSTLSRVYPVPTAF
ncbi:tyrosine-type recombinase/integrase [Variovorax sp. RTB1]|uniref:tyrosine-type recombinase/integrase n=1 Tax=Variovorax sp. RTB1 TaxID=3048631 RepID=UPI002B23E07D|nr:tyrosine-type recombinase/integrase [Variovorax sp. RTB1]MEB0112544.1 tyrosine-type recombinase/integrase [Variovorax sp. RTB1]